MIAGRINYPVGDLFRFRQAAEVVELGVLRLGNGRGYLRQLSLGKVRRLRRVEAAYKRAQTSATITTTPQDAVKKYQATP